MNVRLVPVVTVLALAGCGNPKTGPGLSTLTGVASPCADVVKSHQFAQLPVRVTLESVTLQMTGDRESQVTRPFRSQVVRGTHTYGFTLSAGNYVITSNQPTAKPVSVFLNEGQLVRVNLPTSCK